jgi:hypothetical protein
MSTDTILGVTVIVVALGVLAGLVAWSHRAMGVIQKRNLRSVRDIRRGLKAPNGKEDGSGV